MGFMFREGWNISLLEHDLRTSLPLKLRFSDGQDLTGAARTWAERCEVGEVLRYSRGSKETGIGNMTYVRLYADTRPFRNTPQMHLHGASISLRSPFRVASTTWLVLHGTRMGTRSGRPISAFSSQMKTPQSTSPTSQRCGFHQP